MNRNNRLDLQRSWLSIYDTRRKNSLLALPEAETVLEVINEISLMSKVSTDSPHFYQHRIAVSKFGASAITIAKIWEMILDLKESQGRFQNLKLHYLLWGFVKVKNYADEGVMAELCGNPTNKTFRKWSGIAIEAIIALKNAIIRWDNRFIGAEECDDGAHASVDCTDCQFQQILIDNPRRQGRKTINKKLYSYKIKKPALRYEVAISLWEDRIVWVNGPYLPGEFNDLQIFRHSLIHMLEPNERVIADKIYRAEAPEKVICDGMIGDYDLDILKRAEGRHENLNRRLKQFSCLSDPFRGRNKDAATKPRDHAKMFNAVCVIVQVAMEIGEQELYDI